MISRKSTRERGGKGQIICKISIFVHSKGVGVKIGQNLVHVVVECPLGQITRRRIILLQEAHLSRLMQRTQQMCT